MKAPLLDFARPRIRTPWWSVLLLLLGLAACAWGAWRHITLQAELARLQAVAAREDAQRSAAPPPKPGVALPAAEARAVAQAVDRLNTPWQDLFQRVETLRSPDIALLALEPDPERRTVRLVAEARDLGSMLDFVTRASQRTAFGPGTSLVKHELVPQGADRPYRFELAAPWGGSER